MSSNEGETCQLAPSIRSLLDQRDLNSTICLSEVARSLSEDWRELMPEVRQAADRLQKSNKISVLQKGILSRRLFWPKDQSD